MTAGLPQGYQARPATRDDVDVVVELHVAVDLQRHGRSEASPAWIEERWSGSWVDLASMTRVVIAPDGRAAGFAELESGDPSTSIDTFVAVHPEELGRGVGAFLLAWSESAAAALAPHGATVALHNSIEVGDEAGARLLEACGYRHVRTFWHMRMTLDPPVDPGPIPHDVLIRPSIEGDDDVGIWETMHEAFRDHFGYVEIPFDRWWSDARSAGTYQPGLFLVAQKAGRIVGVSRQFEVGELGWVGELGVRPEAQGAGIGRALLRHALADLAGRGFEIAQLNVDAGNERGATRLYASVGMSVHREWLVYEKGIRGEGLDSRTNERAS